MELRDYITLLHKNWIWIVTCVLLGTAAAIAYSVVITPQYQANTKLYVSVRSSDGAVTGDLVQGTSFARQAVVSYVDVVTSARVLDRVIKDVRLNTTSHDLATQISATSPLNSVLIGITVTNTSPQRAAEIANSVGENFIEVVVNELEKPEGDSPSLVKIETIEPATPPITPSKPNIPLNIAIGLLAGLVVGFTIGILRNTLDTRIHNSHDIEHITNTPILGGISFDPETKRRPLIVHADPHSPRAESFRHLRTNLQFLNTKDRTRSFAITSAFNGEGKSTTAANLAISLAETGASVAIIDGDLRLPRIATYMGLEGAVGLTDVLVGRTKLIDVLQKWGKTNLFVLPSGTIPPNPSELLGSQAMKQLLDQLTSQFDYVLIDTPPLLFVTDAAVVSKFTSGMLMMVAAGRTKRNNLTQAIRTLTHIDSHLAGIIMTMMPTKGPNSYGYGEYRYASPENETTRTTHKHKRKNKAEKKADWM